MTCEYFHLAHQAMCIVVLVNLLLPKLVISVLRHFLFAERNNAVAVGPVVPQAFRYGSEYKSFAATRESASPATRESASPA